MRPLSLTPNGTVRSTYEYVEAWGMTTGAFSKVLRPRSVEEVIASFDVARRERVPLAVRGGGNTYGDTSINDRGHVLDLSRMDRLIAFDPASGVVELEPGVTIEKLWKSILPHGWWPRVVSGTMFPAIGGVLASNTHGKNNFAVGTVGDACREFDIALPTGQVLTCNRRENADLFFAAIGGMGLLGAFTRIVLDTKRVFSGDLRVRASSPRNLREMMDYFEREKRGADYLVGWIDCFPGGDASGRGLIHHANYLHQGEDAHPERTLSIGHQELPPNILGLIPKGEVWRVLSLFNNDLGMRAINGAKYVAGRLESMREPYLQPHAAFAFLLDYVPNWKWAYGRETGVRGMIQYQPFVPHAVAHDVLVELLDRCRRAELVPYLGVFKRHRPDPFWLTHAVDGWSLAMDFKVDPSRRERLWKLCGEMTEVVIGAGGRFYFAKDSVVSAEQARRFLPADKLAAFAALKRRCDPEGLIGGNLYRRAFRDWMERV